MILTVELDLRRQCAVEPAGDQIKSLFVLRLSSGQTDYLDHKMAGSEQSTKTQSFLETNVMRFSVGRVLRTKQDDSAVHI